LKSEAGNWNSNSQTYLKKGLSQVKNSWNRVVGCGIMTVREPGNVLGRKSIEKYPNMEESK